MRLACKLAPLLLLLACAHAQVVQELGGTGGDSGLEGFQTAVQPVFAITTGSCPAGTLNQSGYTCQINAVNGQPPYSCTLTSGTLPGGLQLVSCSIIGTPVAPAGVFPFQILVTDSASTEHGGTASLSINIGCPAISIITPPQIPAGQEGSPFGPFQFQEVGGIAPFIWSQSSGTLCSGLALSSSGSLTGTPTVQQTCTFGVMVADSCNLGTQTANALFQQQINTNIAITTPPTLPPATAGVAYTQTLHEAGGTGPFTWTTSSTLPGTFTLTSAGLLSGTVTVVGTYTINVTVTDSLNATATAALSLTVACTPLTITTQSPIASCTQGQPYPGFQMNSQGGFGNVTWTAPGLTNVGLAISSGGLITGTCTGVGVFNPTISATDSCSTPQTASGAFQITMNQPNPLVITTGSLPAATVGQPYGPVTMAAQGGVTPYSWKETGAMPGGVTLSNTGTLSGTVITSGNFTPQITVTDARNVSTSQVFNITSTCPALSFPAPTMPQGTSGQAYSFTLPVSGGVTPLTFSLVSGALPTGLTLNSSTGVVSGTPTATGIFPLTFQVKDTCLPSAQIIQQSTSLTIAANSGPLTITTTSVPNTIEGVAYPSTTLVAQGGTPPYTWSVSVGSVPAGMNLSSGGALTGTPTTTGTSNFTAKVTDNISGTATQALSIIVSCVALNITSPSNLPGATQSSPYSFTFANSGGTGAISWSMTGSVPGLSLSTAGVLSGTPTTPGTYNLSVTATDSCNPTPQTANGTFTIIVSQAIAPLTFPNTTLQQATAGVPYSHPVVAQGGVPPYTYSLIGGSFPTGLSLASNGTVSGTATQAVTTNPIIQVTDSQPVSASATFTITSVCPAISSSQPPALPPGVINVAYSSQIQATGGYGTLSHSATGLPTGIVISSAGVLSGTPTVSGSFAIVDTVTDQCSPTPQTFQINVTLQINTALAITTLTPLPTATVSSAYSNSFQGSGGIAPYTWSVGTGLPSTLNVSSAGLLTGTPTTTGTYSFTVTLTDSASNTVTELFIITVVPPTNTPALPVSSLLNWPTSVANSPSPGTIRCVGSPGVTCGATYATIPLALAAAVCGDTIVLQNTQFITTVALNFTLQCNASNWLTVTRDYSDTTFPPEGTQPTQCYMGAPPTAFAGLPTYTCTVTGRHMPQIMQSGAGASVNVTCSYCRFIGIEWTRDNTFDLSFGLIGMQINSCTAPNLACMNSMPTNIIFDRNIGHGDAQRQTTRFIGMAGTRWIGIVDSRCYDIGLTFAGGGGDAQCLADGTGHNFTNVGFRKVTNFFADASTMPQLTGGGFVEPFSPSTQFDGIVHDVWNAYWWAYSNPLRNTQIGQAAQANTVIEGVTYPAAGLQEFTVQPTALQLAENQAYTFQTLTLNDSGQGINRPGTSVPTLTCGTAGGCGTIVRNGEHNVGTGIFLSANQVTYTYTAPAAIPSGNTVTISFTTTVNGNNLAAQPNGCTQGNTCTLTTTSVVTIVASSPTHNVAVGPVAPDLRMQPSYSDSNFNTRQFMMEFTANANYSTTFTWTVDGITNGNSTVGTIQTQSNLALYTSSPTTGNHQICAIAADNVKTCSTVKVQATAPIVGFDLKAFTRKNGYEFKEMIRGLFENSIIENCWASNGNGGGQPCSGILFQPINQNSQVTDGSGNNVGFGPQYISDVTVRYIDIVHGAQGVSAVSLGQALGTHRISITNVLGDDINYQNYGNGFSKSFFATKTDGSLGTTVLGWTALSTPQLDNVSVRHITLVSTTTNPFDVGNNLAQFELNHLTWQDSIIAAPGSSTWINSNGDANDCNTATGTGANNTETRALTKCSSPYIFNHLALINSTACNGGTCGTSVFLTPTQIWQPTLAGVGFVSPNNGNGGDYRLCKTSLGCSTNSIFGAGQADQASDGTDLGADIAGLNTVIATIRGTSPPPPPNTFYVATTGSDSNPGTQALPWLTIAHAIATATAGQTVLVENGTYTQSATLVSNNSGTLGKPITFQSQNKYGAVIQAGSFSGQIISVNGSYVTFQNFEIIGNSSGTNNDGIKFQSGTGVLGGQAIGNKIHQIGTGNCSGGAPIISAQGNAVISGNFIYDYGEAGCNQYEGIYLNDGNNQTVTNNLVIEGIGGSTSATIGIQVNGQEALVTNFPSNQNVSNNTIANMTSWCTLWASWSGTASNNNFNNNVCYTTGTNGTSGSVRTANNGGGFGTNSFANNLINNSGSSSMAAGTALTATVTSAPQFVNYTGDQTGDYHPCSSNGVPAGCTGTSPLINGGTTVGAPAIDFDGFTRTPPIWIGAYQNSQ